MIIAKLCVHIENVYCVVEAMLSTLNFASLLYTHKLLIANICIVIFRCVNFRLVVTDQWGWRVRHTNVQNRSFF